MIVQEVKSLSFLPVHGEEEKEDRQQTDKLVTSVKNFFSSDNQESTSNDQENLLWQKPYQLLTFQLVKKTIKKHRQIVIVLDKINQDGGDNSPARITYFHRDKTNHICQAVHKKLKEIFSSNHSIEHTKLLLVSESAFQALKRVIKIEKGEQKRVENMLQSLSGEEGISQEEAKIHYCTLI